ncbi:family 2 glycosyl transferase [Methylorubrum populi]|uniref:Family 2 glycosyl transferase n=1 Tax=Methylorubrum populi TaxID=223967 RepID=A0A160PC18_9HYPH|nr:glycosyltransferase [Methylorubrum populi]BAU89473.1 family 2 glycosyl transferase [Methylorubrum populi]
MRRREALGLYPLRDLRRPADDGAWTATGPDPAFALGPAAAVAALSATRIRIRCRPEAVQPVLAVEAAGEAEPRRYRLTLREGGTDDLIRLPPGTRALRLEAAEAGPRFRLDAVQVEPSGRIEAAVLSARRIIERLPPQERRPSRLLRRAFGLVRSVPPREIWRRLTRAAGTRRPPATYTAWIREVEARALPSAEAMRAQLATLPERPLISLLMVAGEADPVHLAEAVASLRAQIYPDWELCLVAETVAETGAETSVALRALAAEDDRIRLLSPAESAATSRDAALAQARGSYLATMDPAARLAPHTLLALVRRIAREPDLDLLYTDEDRIGADGARCDPDFKPDWSPETLESSFYIGGLALCRTALVRAVGGFPGESQGAPDYDLVLRLTERSDRVGHVAQVLYHGRAQRRAAAQDPEAAARALTGRARRTGGLALIRALGPEHFALRRRLASRPLVSIVIPTAGRDSTIGGRSVDLLAACLASLRGTSTYDRIEIVAVDNGDLRPQTRAAIERFEARSVTWDKPVFNVAAKMNLGARAAEGTVLVFLNDDISVITPDWIEAMLAQLTIPGVGAVGPKLLFEDNSLQHAGVVFGEGLPDHVRRGFPGDDAGYNGSSLANRNVLAVTGACVMVRRADFEAIGGFDEGYAVNYNDIDLCLRLREHNLRTVYCAEARLHHYESRNRVPTVDPAEQARFRKRWGEQLARDPYYPDPFGIRPPAFELDAERFPLAARRMVEAWR